MKRQRLAALALAALMVLAGCSYEPIINVTPEVEEVTPAGDDTYRLQVTVHAGLDNANGTLSDVRVYGYTLTGDRVCTARFGNLSSIETRMVVCESFPSLLVGDTADRNATIPVDANGVAPDSSEVQTTAKLYQGRQNGTHRFGTVASVPDEDGTFVYEANRPVPTDSTLQTLQCKQWKSHDHGANLSTLGDAPWLGWEQRPPNTSRVYELKLQNYTHLQRHDRSDEVRIDQDAHVHSPEEAPSELVQAVRSANGTQSGYRRLDRSTFYAIVSGLADRPINSTGNFSAAAGRIRGATGSYDNTGINCWTNPPRYFRNPGGINKNRGWYAKVFVSDGDATWVVDVRTRQIYSGPAFENVTAT